MSSRNNNYSFFSVLAKSAILGAGAALAYHYASRQGFGLEELIGYQHSDVCRLCGNSISSTSSTLKRRLGCGHEFHEECMGIVNKEGQHHCPVCRKLFRIDVYGRIA